MGVQAGINFDSFPNQGDWLGRRVKVIYEYDGSKAHYGEIIRDDSVEPYRTIIELDNGRILLATECQFSLV